MARVTFDDGSRLINGTDLNTNFDRLDPQSSSLPVVRRALAPAALTTSATITAAQLVAGIITGNQGAAGAATYTLPTAALTDTAQSAAGIGEGWLFYVINISTVAAEDITIAAGTGWTLVGSMVIESRDSDRANSSGTFLVRKTAAAAYTLYRLA